MSQSSFSQPPGGSADDYTEAWIHAKEVVNDLGSRLPVSFTTPIRTLMHDQARGDTLSPASQFLTTRLLRSPTVKAMFYYISLSLYGERLANSAYLSSADLVRLYKPEDCASILGITYLTRRLMKKKADTMGSWDTQISRATLRSEVGGHIGVAIPALGVARGIFTGSLRELSMLTMGRQSRELYAQYLSHLAATNQQYDFDYELENWGCRHVDVGGNFLQQMGFGIKQAYSFLTGLGPTPPKAPESDPRAFEYQTMETWIESLLVDKVEPKATHLGQYYPTEKDKYRLLYEVNEIHDTGSKHKWLSRRKEDINPQSTPQLFLEFLNELEQTPAMKDFYQENLPEEVLNDLSEEELDELTNDKPRLE
jgi:hypothetical protein